MPAIKSSMMNFAEYDATEKELEITFTNGTVHVYFAVPKDIYENFLKSNSQGKFFNEFIKNEFETKKRK